MFGIISFGNQGMALYSYLLSKKYKAIVFTTNRNNLNISKIEAIDKINGQFQLNITDNLEKVLNNDIIFITSITTAYEDIAKMIVAYKDYFDFKKKIFVLLSSKLGGALVFNKIFLDNSLDSNAVETDAIFACRKIDPSKIWVRGIKRWNLLISNKDSSGSRKDLWFYKVVKDIFDDIDLQIADNFIQRGLTDFGAMAHPVISLINLSNIDSKREMLFYVDGLTRNTVVLIEKVYEEFNEVAKSFGTFIIKPRELLYRYYGTLKDRHMFERELIDVIHYVYKHTKMPSTLNDRFLYEDVLNTLYPLTLIAKDRKISLSLVNCIVNIISTVLNIDLERMGRTLEKMGVVNVYR